MKVIEQLKQFTHEGFLTMYEAMAEQGFGPLDHEVAKALRFRPQAIRKLPMAKRAKKAHSILIERGQAELCYELFGSYLIQKRKELVTGFLDATGVEHEDGMLEDLEDNKPDAAKIAEAVKELDGKFDPQDVTLYLSIAAEQWPGLKELDEVWRSRLTAAATSD
jgi:hypothetical protein